MADAFLLVTQFLTAAVLLALAGWLLWLKFDHALNRVFAFYLIIRAVLLVTLQFQQNIATDPAWVSFWSVVYTYFAIFLPFVLIYFLFVYLEPKHHVWLRVATVLLTVGVSIAFLIDHCLVDCTTADGRAFGPLSLVTQGITIITGGVGLVMALNADRSIQGLGRSATGLIAGALLLEAMVNSTISWALVASIGWSTAISFWVNNAWNWVPILWYGLGLLPAATGIAVLMVKVARREETRHQVEVLAVLTVLALATGAFVGAAPDTVRQEWRLFIIGLWRLILPALVVVALVKHQLFGIDIRLKTAVKSSTIAAIFAGGFFIGSELLEDIIPLDGKILGLVVSALIALALRPIQKIAQRVAERTFPGVKPLDQMDSIERLHVFEEQVRLAWADGTITEKERVLLDRLQVRLGITKKQVNDVEKVLRAEDHDPLD